MQAESVDRPLGILEASGKDQRSILLEHIKLTDVLGGLNEGGRVCVLGGGA